MPGISIVLYVCKALILLIPIDDKLILSIAKYNQPLASTYCLTIALLIFHSFAVANC